MTRFPASPPNCLKSLHDRQQGWQSGAKRKKLRVRILEDDDSTIAQRTRPGPRSLAAGSEDEDTGYLAPLTLSDDEDDDDYDGSCGSFVSSTVESTNADDVSYDEASNDAGASPKRRARSIAPRPSVAPTLFSGKKGRENRRVSSAVAKCIAASTSKSSAAPLGSRRRRRSSAQFLRLSGRFSLEGKSLIGGNEDRDDDIEEIFSSQTSTGDIADMYRQVVRLNAANKISAANSWSLNLIDHMDRIIAPLPPVMEEEEEEKDGEEKQEKGVNFTRASCTIDASVKIYSYRVDDVHLSSYKVLANLNRSDKGKDDGGFTIAGTRYDNGSSNPIIGNEVEDTVQDGEDDEVELEANGRSNRKKVDTIEKNIANLNITKLDSALDIDPLFHKMSATFDEGGAKGMLLNNLRVSAEGCGIVFDSCEDDCNLLNYAFAEQAPPMTNEEGTQVDESFYESDRMIDVVLGERRKTSDIGEVDISALTSRLVDVLGLNRMSLEAPFLPQLTELRNEMASLENEGFDASINVAKERKGLGGGRYSITEYEEEEAERIIHQEHLERSQMLQLSQMNLSMLSGISSVMDASGAMDVSGFNESFSGPETYGGDEAEDQQEFTEFMAGSNETSLHFSEEGALDFDLSPSQNIFNRDEGGSSSRCQDVLDYIATAAEGTITTNGTYEFFDPACVSNSLGGNLWAGVAHWKRCRKKVLPKNMSKAVCLPLPNCSETKAHNNVSSKRIAFFNLSNVANEEIFVQPVKKKRGRSDLLCQTKVALVKQLAEDNLLPTDAGVDICQLAKLFLRPDLELLGGDVKRDVGSSGVEREGRSRTVAFAQGLGDDISYGDDDAQGFVIRHDEPFEEKSYVSTNGDNYDDNIITELEDIRKVEKIDIEYATVSKKVDVKRLKTELWREIEPITKLSSSRGNDDMGSNELALEHKENNGYLANEVEKSEIMPELAQSLSFQNTVEKLNTSQRQMGVTVPFYFICLLHLANEKGLKLESLGLDDLRIKSED